MKSIAWCLGLLMGMLPLCAQSQRANPVAIVQMLSSNQKTPQAEHLVKQLELTNYSSGRACTEFSDVTQKTLWGHKADSIRAIEAYSNSCIEKFIIVLEGSSSQWRFAGTISLKERYTAPDYKVVPLFIEQKPGIMVTDNIVDSGTGISQANTQIFAFLGSALKMVFDQPEKITLAAPFKSKCCDTQYVESQASKFKVIGPTRQSPIASIEEVRRISGNGRALTVYRRFVWNRRWHTFYSVAFAPVP